MQVSNDRIADLLEETADLLEIEGASPFRVRAYRNAALVARDHDRSLAEMAAAGEDLDALPGVGASIAEKIVEIATTGKLASRDDMLEKLGPGVLDLLKISGLGPKKVRALHDTLGIESLEALEKAAAEERIRELPGFGQKTEERILRSVRRRRNEDKRFLLADVEPVAEELSAFLRAIPGVAEVAVAGSYRRRKETVGDLDLLVSCEDGATVGDRFVSFPDVARIVSHGDTRCTVILGTGLQVDLRVVPAKSFGAALHYFTGSKAHNIAIRTMGVNRGRKINEYGVFEGETQTAGRTEEEVYATVGLPYVEPELRENRGEIEAAREGTLPRLVTLEDIRGDLHCHAPGQGEKIDGLARAAEELGYEYLALTPRTARVYGLGAKEMREHLKVIERANREHPKIRWIRAAEIDILDDGSLDLEDDILRDLELTVCAVHTATELSMEKQTERILRAMDHPSFHVLAHPTGRLLGERPALDVDVPKLIEGAAQRGCFLELNAHPKRMDLPDIYCRAAKEAGVLVMLGTDAHASAGLGTMRLGVGQARRGWLEAKHVLNSRSWLEMQALLRRGRS